MEKMKESMAKLIVCVGEAAVGIVLLINPEGFSKFVLIAAGILFAVLGALSMISYFRMDPAEAALSQELTRGLIALSRGWPGAWGSWPSACSSSGRPTGSPGTSSIWR